MVHLVSSYLTYLFFAVYPMCVHISTTIKYVYTIQQKKPLIWAFFHQMFYRLVKSLYIQMDTVNILHIDHIKQFNKQFAAIGWHLRNI